MENPLSKDLGWKQGLLPSDVREELNSSVILSHLSDLHDCLSAVGLFDVNPSIISSAEGSVSCIVPGPKFSKAFDIIKSRALSLWSNAVEMRGPIRFSAVDSPDGVYDGKIRYQWPLTESLAGFLIPERNFAPGTYKGFSVGVSNLVTDPESASKLRQLREQYIYDRTLTPVKFSDGQIVDDGKTEAFIYMRDALPYEDEHGLWPF